MKSYVTLEQKVCPACGRAFDTGALLMDQRMRDRFERTTITGMALCPDDQRKVDEGFRILVAIDETKSGGRIYKNPEDVYRTGEIAYIKKDVADKIMPLSKGHDLVWVQPEVISRLRELEPCDA